jgi:hypothetical protein
MVNAQNKEAIRQFTEIISEIEKKQKDDENSIGLEIENSEDIKIGTCVTKGYATGTKITGSKRVIIDLLDNTAPEGLKEIHSVLEDMVTILKSNEKPESALRQILKKITPYIGWVNLAFNVLRTSGVLQ